MVDYEVLPDKDLNTYIQHGPKTAALMAHPKVDVEGVSGGDWSFALPDTNVMIVGFFACLIVFVTVISVFMYHREKIRRIVTGENRRVGSVYYVRPGIKATQPTEI